jgi:hypothetical protein
MFPMTTVFISRIATIASAALCMIVGDSDAASANTDALPAKVREFRHFVEAETFEGVATPEGSDYGEAGAWIQGVWNRTPPGPQVSGKYAILPTDAKAVCSHKFSVPADGEYFIWVFHGINPGLLTTFQMKVLTGGDTEGKILEYAPVKPSDNYEDEDYIHQRGRSMAWSVNAVQLKKGEVEIRLLYSPKSQTASRVDALFITGDPGFVPNVKDRAYGGILNLRGAE